MGLLVTFIVGLMLWIVLWALGAKVVAVFLITVVMVVVAAAVRAYKPLIFPDDS